MKVIKLVFLILTICGFSACNSNLKHKDDNIANYLAHRFKSYADRDGIKYQEINVKIDTSEKLKRAHIYWNPVIFDHTKFIIEYNQMILRNIDLDSIQTIDTVILEINVPNSSFGVKRYFASIEELETLINSYEVIEAKFDPFLRYIISHEYVGAIEYLDLFMKERNTQSFSGKVVWLDNGFLDYIKSFFRKVDSPETKEDEIIIFKEIFYDAPIWDQKRRTYNLLNFVREQVGIEKVEFSIEDTTIFGVCPNWLKD